MKTLEYLALVLICSALTYLGATAIGNSISASFHASAERIETASR